MNPKPKPNNMKFKLTPKQQAFCDHYLCKPNATLAAQLAGYSYSSILSGHIMEIPKIRLYLAQKMEALDNSRHEAAYQTVLAELIKVAYSDMGNYFNAGGGLKAMNELTSHDTAAIKWIKTTTAKDGSTTTTIKLHDKMQALEKIARHLDFYNPTRRPQMVYKYIDKDELDADDCFDDADYTPAVAKAAVEAAEEAAVAVEEASAAAEEAAVAVEGAAFEVEKIALGASAGTGDAWERKEAGDETDTERAQRLKTEAAVAKFFAEGGGDVKPEPQRRSARIWMPEVDRSKWRVLKR